jgi:hypothetical protein
MAEPETYGSIVSLGPSAENVEGGVRRIMSFLAELWDFFKIRKKFWLLPIILVMLLFGALLIFAQGSAVAPFIYTLF